MFLERSNWRQRVGKLGSMEETVLDRGEIRMAAQISTT
jgi:hypothetical protein